MKNYLVFDIGGTFTKFAFFRGNKILEDGRESTPRNLIDLLERICKEILLKYNLRRFDGIAISVPGSLDYRRLELVYANNLKKARKIKFGSLGRFSKKIVLENDASCAALGVLKFEDKEFKNLICFTLGTGLGTGIIINGNLYKGSGNASEFAHTIVDVKNGKCSCGNVGCLENSVSVRGLLKIARKNKLNVDCFGLSKLAKQRNRMALKTYKEFGKNVAVALINAANTFDPNLIVLTGGLCNSADFFMPVAREIAKNRYYPGINPRVQIYKKNLSIIGARGLLG